MPRQPRQPPRPPAPQLTREDLEAWLDGFLPYALARGNIAGGIVVVVKDGQVLLQKGFGYADVEKKLPVDPEQTLFRPGSVSKLFTWTAVMQLVERGKIDLDADINQYLDFKIPPGPDGEPITMRDLMTHTAGFEEQVKELISEDPSRISDDRGDAEELGARPHLQGRHDARLFELRHCPGRPHRRARVAGVSFDDYLDQNIFGPLGMTHSSFRQPLPEALMAGMAQGYEDATGKPQGYELINLSPAGSLAATGADMARFMIAHLQNGAFGDARILSEETAKKMHGTPLTIIPNVNRMVLGFYETDTNGHRIISHGGDTQYFHSDLHLFIDDGVGYFISFNSARQGRRGGPAPRGVLPQLRGPLFPRPRGRGQGGRGDGEGSTRPRSPAATSARAAPSPTSSASSTCCSPPRSSSMRTARSRSRCSPTSTASRRSGARSRPTSGARLTARRGSRPR